MFVAETCIVLILLSAIVATQAAPVSLPLETQLVMVKSNSIEMPEANGSPVSVANLAPASSSSPVLTSQNTFNSLTNEQQFAKGTQSLVTANAGKQLISDNNDQANDTEQAEELRKNLSNFIKNWNETPFHQLANDELASQTPTPTPTSPVIATTRFSNNINKQQDFALSNLSDIRKRNDLSKSQEPSIIATPRGKVTSRLFGDPFRYG